MPSELPFSIALALTLAVSASIVLFLWHPLQGILVEYCGSEQRARFWRAHMAAVLLLMPLVAIMIAAPDRVSPLPLFFDVIQHAKFGLLGLLIALLVVGIGVASLAQVGGPTISVSPEQMGDVERLLSKVDQIRARHILRRTPDQEETGT